MTSRLRFLALLALLTMPFAAPLAAQESGVTVNGTVRDTLARIPLPGAIVQIVSVDAGTAFSKAVTADGLGRYAIPDVPAGLFQLGFLHPRLDSLGMQAPVVEVRVARRPLRVDLVSPTIAQLRYAACGTSLGGALLMGTVRDAKSGAPVADATVVGEWLEYTLRRGAGLERARPKVTAVTGENGVYAMCDVPSGGSLFLTALAGSDTTDFIEVAALPTGLIRRDLFIGKARVIVTGDTVAASTDSAATIVRRRRLGDGRLRGSVRTLEGNRPLPNAIVRIVDGPMVRTNASGEWILTEAPTGTRVLEIRAIGFYPIQRAVDVVPNAPPITAELATFQAVLDTVRIVASAMTDRSEGGFDERRRTRVGVFLDEAQIARRAGLTASDIFRSVPGIRLETHDFDRQILMRSAFGMGSNLCEPGIYIDGLFMFGQTADEIDSQISKDQIRAIEVYNEATAPLEFQRALSGCGVILIWRK